jgi:small subunit ribosomal protein S19
MSRSIKKGPFVCPKLMKKIEGLNAKGSRDPINTYSRASVIVPEFVGHTIMVHNGRVFLKCYVTEDMVGHRLGEFSPTRTFRGHSSKKVETGAPA